MKSRCSYCLDASGDVLIGAIFEPYFVSTDRMARNLKLQQADTGVCRLAADFPYVREVAYALSNPKPCRSPDLRGLRLVKPSVRPHDHWDRRFRALSEYEYMLTCLIS
jgi:hypothetical protein